MKENLGPALKKVKALTSENQHLKGEKAISNKRLCLAATTEDGFCRALNKKGLANKEAQARNKKLINKINKLCSKMHNLEVKLLVTKSLSVYNEVY